MTDQFKEIAETLERSGCRGLFVQKRIPCSGVLDVYAARKVESGLEGLLVQVDPKQLSGIEDWPQSEGFQVIIRPVEGKPGQASLICLELTEPRFRDVFISLAQDVCDVIEGETHSREAIQGMHRRLFRWQEFLKRHRPDGLPDEGRAGLFGELEVLRTMFLTILDPAHAVSGWRGCRKAHQDFQFPGFALEVKATRATTPDRIHISNLQQLDEDGIDDMFLTLVWIHQNQSAGFSLSRIVREIRHSLPDPALRLFNEGLIEVGYLDIHEPLYEKELYQVRTIRSFAVRDDFPRLRFGQMPKGVRGVKYQIGIDACDPFEVDPDVVKTSIRNLKK